MYFYLGLSTISRYQLDLCQKLIGFICWKMFILKVVHGVGGVLGAHVMWVLWGVRGMWDLRGVAM